MTEQQTKHPLHGVGLKPMLIELVSHYDWPILAEQIPLKCFASYPTVASSAKFLHKTQWARERVEAFYLYRYKQIPLPTDEQHALPPRERDIALDQLDNPPAEIKLGDLEFFDDPASGPIMPSKKAVQQTQSKAKKARDTASQPSRRSRESERQTEKNPTTNSNSSDNSTKVDPWSKWRK